MVIETYNKFGSGFYRFSCVDHFEYNPHATEEKATIFGDVSKRMPIGSMGINVGDIVQAQILEYVWSDICDCYMAHVKVRKKFSSKKYGSILDAFKAAAEWIVHEGEGFLKTTHRQMDLFSTFAEAI